MSSTMDGAGLPCHVLVAQPLPHSLVIVVDPSLSIPSALHPDLKEALRHCKEGRSPPALRGPPHGTAVTTG